MSTDLNEYDLITRTQQGDTEAFNPLVRKYQHRIYTHILGNVKNIETAKDLTQKTWIKAFRAIHTFRGASAFYSWLYRIAENVCMDYFRKQKHHIVLQSLHVTPERDITQTHSDPAVFLQQQELRDYLQNAIAELTPIRKRVFQMYYIEERSIKDIATHTRRSEGTIKTHLRNARLQLRERLTLYLKNEDIS